MNTIDTRSSAEKDLHNMAKICFICISLRAGGTERVVTRLANDFCNDHSVSIVTIQVGDSFYELDERVQLYQNCKRKSDLPKWLAALSILKYLKFTIRKIQPDVILSFGELISPLARVASLGTGARFLIFNRESPLRSLSGYAGIINPMIYPLADIVVTQTVQAMQLLKRRYRFSRFRTIPNPVDIPCYVPSIEKRTKRIISVGYLGGEKNQQSLLKAFSTSRFRTDWKLTIIGDGPHRSKLEKMSIELGISAHTEFLGERKDVPNILIDSRIFAFTSLSEGFPNALSEALAYGCACIAFDCVAGPSELIRNNENGFLVQPNNLDTYSSKLELLMGDDTLQQGFSVSARQDIIRFSKDIMFEMYSEIVLDGIVARKS